MPHGLTNSLIFIDGTNLDHRLARGISSLDVDYTKLFAKLAQGTSLQHVHYFTAPYVKSSNPRKQEMRSRQLRTFNRLQNLNYVSLHKDGRYQPREDNCYHCGRRISHHVEKGTDVHAASKLVWAACTGAANEFIFVANDNDFAPAFRICHELGSPVVLAYVVASAEDHRKVGELRRFAKRTITIDHAFMDELWLSPPGPASYPESGRRK